MHVEFHSLIEKEESSASWQFKKRIYERALPIHQAPNVFNSEVFHWQIASITDVSSQYSQHNKIIQLFGQYFIALDWRVDQGKVLIFETYKDQDTSKSNIRFDGIAASPSNENVVLYSSETNTMVHVNRDRYSETEHVLEDWVDIDLS